ncbi:MAG: hypothetical protein WDO71_00595 [Bacteroidota bacterium]
MAIGLLAFLPASEAQQNNLGSFDEHGDVGSPALKGDVVYNKEDQTYLMSAAGKNVWRELTSFIICGKK